MRVLLIRPRTISDAKKGKKLSRKIIIYPDLTLSQLAGNTPEKHDIEIIFEYYEKINFNWDGDLVGITCVTPQAPEAYRIADKFRSKGLKVVLGGWHPSALPDEAKQHADSVVIGEAEETWSQLLSDLEKNALRQFYRNEKSVDLNLIKNAKRSACKDFSFVAGIQATRKKSAIPKVKRS